MSREKTLAKSAEKLSLVEDIWESRMSEENLVEAIEYATVSLPWTFDRMHYGPRTQNSVNNRLWHIVSGVLNQSILEKKLKELGYQCKMDWSHYRLSDIFDFTIGDKIYDVKTCTVFQEYDADWEREKFSPELLFKYRSYPGPKWRHFFPMMVPMTQLNMEMKKNGYIFGVAVSKYDQRKLIPQQGDDGFWCAAPFGDANKFFHKKALILERESASQGFTPKLKWVRSQDTLDLEEREVTATIYGEWNGNKKTESLKLSPGEKCVTTSEFSSLSCIQIENPANLGSDTLEVGVKNNFRKFVPDISDPSKNLNDSNFTWELQSNSFVNLRVSKNYKVYWIGFIPVQEFAVKFLDYSCYFIPDPNNMDDNTPGRLSVAFREGLEAYDRRREKAISKGVTMPWQKITDRIKGNSLNAGIMISVTRGGARNLGAACYYYPPYGFFESAMYVLARDLHPMKSL